MLEKVERILYLFRKYFRKELSQEEQNELEAWLSENEKNRKLLSDFSDDETMEEKMRLAQRSEMPNILAKVQERMNNMPLENNPG